MSWRSPRSSSSRSPPAARSTKPPPRLDRYAWVVVTSANGAEAVLAAAARVGADSSGARFAAVGSSTTAVLTARGVPVAFTSPRSSGDGIADEIPLRPGDRILLARTDIADGRLPERLRERGAVVDEVVAYRTVEAPGASREPLAEAFAAGPFDALVFTSGSTVRGLLALLSPQQRRLALRSVACCIGPTTARVARECGFGRVAEAPTQSAAALAEIIACRRPPGSYRPGMRSSPVTRQPDEHPRRARLDPPGPGPPAAPPPAHGAAARAGPRDPAPPPPARGPDLRPARAAASGRRSRPCPVCRACRRTRRFPRPVGSADSTSAA